MPRHHYHGLDRFPGVKSPGYRGRAGVVIVQCADLLAQALATSKNYRIGNSSAINLGDIQLTSLDIYVNRAVLPCLTPSD